MGILIFNWNIDLIIEAWSDISLHDLVQTQVLVLKRLDTYSTEQEIMKIVYNLMIPLILFL